MYLGLDLGTTNVKAIVVDDDGRTVASGAAAVDRFYTPDGRRRTGHRTDLDGHPDCHSRGSTPNGDDEHFGHGRVQPGRCPAIVGCA